MKSSHSASAWTIFKKKLKERYDHLTDADLADIEKQGKNEQWLECVQRRIGGTTFEIARLVEEVTEAEEARPVPKQSGVRSMYL